MSDLSLIRDSLNNFVSEAKKNRNQIVGAVSSEVLKVLAPLLREIEKSARLSKEDIKMVAEEIASRISLPEVNVPEISVPDVYVPDIKVPEPKVTVNVPDVIVPEIKMPEEMDIRGWVRLQGVDLDNPLPVQLRDAKGRPVNLFENLTTLIGGGGGGIAHNVRIGGFSQSAYADYLNADGRIRVSVETGGAGLTDAELRASSVPVAQASGASWSVEASQGNGWVVNQVSGANFSVEVASQPITFDVKQVSGSIDSVSVIGTVPVSGPLTDTQLRASSVPVEQVSGSNWSVFATNPVAQGDAATALRVVIAGNSDASVSATQVGNWTVSLSGSLASAVVTGPSAVGTADDGTAPVQMSGISRQANPTAISGGGVVKSSHDDLGRQLIRPVQVRDLISTAYVSLTTGTETTLLAAVAGAYLDLIYIMGTNSSDAAVTVDIRAVTAGNVQTSIRIPANGTAGVALPVPIPQDETGNNWTADLPDITGTTVTLSALFTREV